MNRLDDDDYAERIAELAGHFNLTGNFESIADTLLHCENGLDAAEVTLDLWEVLTVERRVQFRTECSS